jgi:2-keto-4-pentenoate hydratase/2-oxohepta-3-ene-1,7-dioic acid hydratase in catechol pathway
LGPWIETEFEPKAQRIETTVNGQIRQSEPISSMIFKIPAIIEFITSVMTLLPGDVILTGTPAGIGPADALSEIVISIEGLGVLRNTVSEQQK